MRRLNLVLWLFLTISFLTAACGFPSVRIDKKSDVFDLFTESAGDCFADETYDAEAGLCIGADPADRLAERPGDCLPNEEYDWEERRCVGDDLLPWWADRPQDCFADEEYDAEEFLCYEVYDCAEGEDCGEAGDDLFPLVQGLTDRVLSELSGSEYPDFDEMGDDALVTYEVQGNEIVNPENAAVSGDKIAYQEDVETHLNIWLYFSQLIPAENRQLLSQFVIFSDGPEEIMASVSPDFDDPTRWILAVDVVDAEDPAELTDTLIHEFGHILTLNNEQVPINRAVFLEPDNEELYDEAEQACPRFFTGEGCSLRDSYIQAFYQRFWTDLYPILTEIEWEEDDELYYERLEEFYETYQDRFVNEYAATNPGEDIAESWTLFVLRPKPAGETVAEEKILFFYDYPELVTLRDKITKRLYSRLRRR